MRKMKKINGYLVVRFNDRERRDYETLGAYGVIDAELYTGHLDVDRGALEYDDAETMEQAIEQARGLESELDVEEPEAAVTVIVETEAGTAELETTPEELIQGEKRFLETRRPPLSQEAADWQMFGYVRALRDLGIVDSADERFQVTPPPSTGGAPAYPEYPECLKELIRKTQRETRRVLKALAGGTAPGPEDLRSYVCDELCRHRLPEMTQEQLDAVCARCSLERLADEAELRVRAKAHQELNSLITELRETRLNTKAERLEHEARAYLRALTAAGAVTEQEGTAYASAIEEALAARPYEPKRMTFENLHPQLKNNPLTRKLYGLGLALAQECPSNDCRVYLNIFNGARELDATLDELAGSSTPALYLRKALRERLEELAEMYEENYAVRKYREGAKA